MVEAALGCGLRLGLGAARHLHDRIDGRQPGTLADLGLVTGEPAPGRGPKQIGLFDFATLQKHIAPPKLTPPGSYWRAEACRHLDPAELRSSLARLLGAEVCRSRRPGGSSTGMAVRGTIAAGAQPCGSNHATSHRPSYEGEL
jgi:hypothetical protein